MFYTHLWGDYNNKKNQQKQKPDTNNNTKTEKTRTMTTTDTGVNNIMMPLFLQVLASNFMDKHRKALDEGRDEDSSM